MIQFFILVWGAEIDVLNRRHVTGERSSCLKQGLKAFHQNLSSPFSSKKLVAKFMAAPEQQTHLW